MTTESNRAVAMRFFDDIANGRKPELAREVFTADYVYHDPQLPGVVGPEAMAAVVKVYQDTVEGHWRVDSVHGGEDGFVTVRWTGQGKHVAEVPGTGKAPTGNAIDVSAISVFRIVDGKIADQWCVWDTMGFMQQIGVVPKG